MTAWIDRVAAIVWAGYPGESGVYALGKILVGKISPSGRLTQSFPKSAKEVPVLSTFRDSSRSVYSDGLLVGYRWYDMERELFDKSSVLFPFGYGLSYARFSYNSLSVETKENGTEVRFILENISSVNGAEVVQVYVREVHSKVFRPYKELKAFKKVFLSAGEKKEVVLNLERSAFAFYSVALDCWTVNPGVFEIIIASDANTVRLKTSIILQ